MREAILISCDGRQFRISNIRAIPRCVGGLTLSVSVTFEGGRDLVVAWNPFAGPFQISPPISVGGAKFARLSPSRCHEHASGALFQGGGANLS